MLIKALGHLFPFTKLRKISMSLSRFNKGKLFSAIMDNMIQAMNKDITHLISQLIYLEMTKLASHATGKPVLVARRVSSCSLIETLVMVLKMVTCL